MAASASEAQGKEEVVKALFRPYEKAIEDLAKKCRLGDAGERDLSAIERQNADHAWSKLLPYVKNCRRYLLENVFCDEIDRRQKHGRRDSMDVDEVSEAAHAGDLQVREAGKDLHS